MADKDADRERYLVVGGGGFLGRRIVDMLLERGEKVSVFDLRQTFTDERLEAYHVGDICSVEAVITACRGQTVVLHTASPIHGLPAAVYHKVNVDGTRNVISACQVCSVKKLVFTSSASVIYDGSDLVSADETVPYCEVHMDAYNETKVCRWPTIATRNMKAHSVTGPC